jgi:hypothetical protein
MFQPGALSKRQFPARQTGELRVATFQFVGLVLLAFVICPIITKHLPISR